VDRVRTELVGPLVVAERRREAARERVLAAADRGGASGRLLAGAVGRLLVRVGSRLETAGAVRAAATSFAVVADPCRGCAN
jgi:hypothetical protein